MQIAGAGCTICDETIVSQTSGRGCVACELAFHTDCLRAQRDEHQPTKSRAQRCPKCRENFKATARAARAARDNVDDAVEGRGRGLVSIIVGFLILAGASPLFMGLLIGAPTPFMLSGVLQLALSGVVLYSLWIGRGWALKLTIATLLFGAIWSGLHFGEESWPDAMQYIAVCLAIIYTVAAGVLGFAPSVRAFIYEQQRRHGSSQTR